MRLTHNYRTLMTTKYPTNIKKLDIGEKNVKVTQPEQQNWFELQENAFFLLILYKEENNR